MNHSFVGPFPPCGLFRRLSLADYGLLWFQYLHMSPDGMWSPAACGQDSFLTPSSALQSCHRFSGSTDRPSGVFFCLHLRCRRRVSPAPLQLTVAVHFRWSRMTTRPSVHLRQRIRCFSHLVRPATIAIVHEAVPFAPLLI